MFYTRQNCASEKRVLIFSSFLETLEIRISERCSENSLKFNHIAQLKKFSGSVLLKFSE